MTFTCYPQNLHDLVKKFWVIDGMSKTAIAKKLGIARSTVRLIGERYKLKPAAGSFVRTLNPRPKPAPKPAAPVAPMAMGPIGDFPAGETCRFIAGEVRDFQCCGHPGHPYCDYHRALTLQKAKAA